MSKYFEKFCLTLAAAGAIICISPLFLLHSQKSGSELATYHTLVPNFIFIIIIPAADLLLDLLAHCVSYFRTDQKRTNRTVESSVVSRLTDSERLLFILGVAINSIVLSDPNKEVTLESYIVGNSVNNCSVFLTLSPILIYLGRCTDSFTCRKIIFILVTGFIGMTFYTASYYCQIQASLASYDTIVLVANAFVSASGIVLILSMSLCAISYCRQKLNCPIAKQMLQRLLFLSPKVSIAEIHKDDCLRIDTDKELYTNYIPALHMLSLLLLSVANVYVKYTRRINATRALENKNFITLVAEIMVLVIELRIRKNEIARGLVALLDSKKSYVRYISHELRTPLNTAFLGLKLLTDEIKASKDPRDIERYDTLCDVNVSCMVAVDILNDLLCYEKLDSGILELHKEDVTVGQFLNESVSMFSAQARESGVTMTVVSDFGTDIDDDISTTYSLQLHDTIFVDKFKMDQVIRNLISNALKFTPRGGTISVTANFVSSRGIMDDRTVSTSGGAIFYLPCNLMALAADCCFPGCRTTTVPPLVNSSVNTNSATSPIDGHLVVVVTDSGAGISTENQKRLFKDIVQFSPEKLQAGGGSGLGLWISGGIVDLHDGKISVHSEGEGMGSSFTVEIPMHRLPPSTTPPQGHSADVAEEILTAEGNLLSNNISQVLLSWSTSTSNSQPSILPPTDHSGRFGSMALNVLVVDDSRLNRKMLLKCLQKDGHRCTEAEDGLQAIERVKQRMDVAIGCYDKPFDAILMDFIMPNMDGPTATKHLRGMGYTGPIFGVTGNGLPSDIEYFLTCGANKVLLKPLDTESFRQAMEEMMTVR